MKSGDTEDPAGVSTKCGDKSCTCCLYLKQTSYIGDEEFSIDGYMDCNSKNVVYIIECQKCNLKYVGETRNCLKTRLIRHISDIRQEKNTAVASHFNYECISDYNLADLKIYPIEFIHDQGSPHKNDSKLLKCETHWIEQLNTLEPNGLNRRIAAKQSINVSMTYSNTAFRAFKTIRESYSRLQSLFPKAYTAELVSSYRRNKNISEYLTRARLK